MAENTTPLVTDYSGVREYIGARYIPVFANPMEWSNTRGYEPLTIVTYQGASYTSMQTVPPGIDISNTEYWALSGNYNAQVEQYRLEVQQYQNTVNTFDSRIDDISTSVEGANSTADQAMQEIAKNKNLIFTDADCTNFPENVRTKRVTIVYNPVTGIANFDIAIMFTNPVANYSQQLFKLPAALIPYVNSSIAGNAIYNVGFKGGDAKFSNNRLFDLQIRATGDIQYNGYIDDSTPAYGVIASFTLPCAPMPSA